jgi:transketolase
VRIAFADTLTDLARKDPRVILLTADLGFQLFDRFIAECGPRYLNVGVAEAQMVLAAAGLAHTGWRPITYSIASFATCRCFEQIKISVAYAGLPVVLVGAGGGFAYGSSGVTHHSAEDLSLLAGLPGMTVVAPGDAEEVRQLLPQVFQLPGPTYLRLGRGREPALSAAEPARLGKARLLCKGQDVAILTTGSVASEALKAVEILKEERIQPVVCHFHTIKPFDVATLQQLASRVRRIVVVEEHVPSGGLSSAVRQWLVQQSQHPELVCLTAPDQFVLGSPHQREIRARFHFDSHGIADAVRRGVN